MTQPQAYNRETDFTERDGDDTNHAGINTELDAAALSINEIRDNLALIQADDGGLKAGIVKAESLDDSAFDAILVDVNLAVSDAQTAAESANIAALSANSARDQAVTAKENAETANNAAALNAATAALKAAETASAVAQAVDGEKDLFTAGVDYTKGTTTQLTLAYAPAKSGTVKVFFDGVFQHLTEWSLAGNVITFTAAIAADKVEVHYVIPSQFVGLSNADLLVLGEAESVAQAGAASAQADAATAVAAKTAAETARDAANVSGRVYATTAAGIAATTSGQYFSVPSPVNAEYLILYLNNSGTAVEIKRYPSTALVAPLILSSPAGYTWAVTDQDGRMVLGVKDDGTTVAGKMQPLAFEAAEVGITGSGMSMKYPTPNGYRWAIIDQDGRMALGLTDGGSLKTVDLVASTLNGVSVQSIITPDPTGAADLGAQNFGADIAHVLSYGQSLSVGIGTGTTPLTTTQRFDNLRFVGGVRRQDTAEPASYASLVPLIETAGGEESACETPIGGATDMVKERIASENGITYSQQSYQLLGSAPGKGAATIAELSKPGTLYSRFTNDVTYGYARAQALGKTYKVPAFFWTQGESDGATTNYASLLSTLRGNVDADVKAITGQSDDVWCICYQTPRPAQALRFNAAMVLDSKIRIACPIYQLPSSDTVHLTATSSKIYGAYLGVAYKRLVIDGIDWKPMMPTTALRQGKVVDLKFNHHGTGLVFDTTAVPIQSNYGFYLFDASNTPITISSVTITQWNTLRIVAATTIPSGAKLRYGFTDPTIGAAGYARGNLRDNAGNTLVFDGAGINHPMHNWCILFELSL